MRVSVPKTASALRTLQLTVGQQAKHLRQAGRHAKRLHKVDPKVVAQRNAEVSNFKPQALPAFKGPKAQATPASKPISKKRTPTQAVSPTDLARHLSKDPKKAIQAGRQYGAPVLGTKTTLAELERTPFHKLSSLIDMYRKNPDKYRKLVQAGAKDMKKDMKKNVDDARRIRWGIKESSMGRVLLQKRTKAN